jgi:glycosyltransferase involved in cell wall biosynthesis
MKVIIQIPCFNEEATLAITLAALPRQLPGATSVEWLVIDDGSTDRTSEIAREAGVHHILRLPSNKGLARAFTAGLEACVHAGADIIVNTDADNQYRASYVADLIGPIVAGRADIVIGARPIDRIEEFSRSKRYLQKLGSWAVRQASRTDVPDSPSGFRAMSREAAMRINVFGEYTYTLETIIQAGQKNMTVLWVPIETNPATRPSRLVKSVSSYVRRSIATIFRIFMIYRPLRFFFSAGLIPFLIGVALSIRWLVLFVLEDPTRARAPSLIAAAVFILIGVQLWTFGLIADLLAANRILLEDVQLRLRRAEADSERRR